MKTVILCGGEGTRLREETEFCPKPLVAIGNHPILWHIMRIYAQYGISEFVLCLGYKGTIIKNYFLNYDAMNCDFTVRLGDNGHIECHGDQIERKHLVTLADTGLRTMTGGRIKRIQKYIDEDIFMVTYGDGVADIDIGKLLQFHRSHGKLATLTTTRPQSRFGVVKTNGQNKIVGFAEKPSEASWISAGFFVFHKKVFDYLGGDDCVLEEDPLKKMVADGQLMSFRHEGFFFAMDTYREYLILNQLWEKGQAPWKIW